MDYLDRCFVRMSYNRHFSLIEIILIDINFDSIIFDNQLQKLTFS